MASVQGDPTTIRGIARFAVVVLALAGGVHAPVAPTGLQDTPANHSWMNCFAVDGNRNAFESRQWKTQVLVEQTADRIHRKDPDAARQYLTTWSIRQQATIDRLLRGWSVRLEDVASGVIRDGR